MAEEILAGELRMGHSRYDADWRNIERSTQRATKSIADSINSIGRATASTPRGITQLNQDLAKSQQAFSQASRAAGDFSNRVGGIKSSLPDFSKFNQSLSQATSSLGKFTQELNRAKVAAEGAAEGTEGLGGTMLSLKSALGTATIVALAAAFKKLASEVVTSGEAMLGVRMRLEQAMGSVHEAAQAMAFVRAETTKLGQSTIEGAAAFSRIATAAKGTVAEGEGARVIFKGISTAMKAMGLSGAETSRVLLQLTQAMNKGKFQGEELNTMAENGIPAFKMLAEAMGVTRERLAEMLQAGEVSSDNAILLGIQLIEEYSAAAEKMAETIPSGFRRMAVETQNELADLGEALFSSQTLMTAFANTTSTIDFLPPVETVRAWIDEQAMQLNEFISIWSIGFLKLDQIIKTAWDSTINFVSSKTKEALESWKDMLAPIDQFMQSSFDSIFNKIMPESVKKTRDAWAEMVSSLNLGPTKTEIEDDADAISNALEGIVDENAVSTSMRKLRLELEKTLGIEGLDFLDPAKVATAVEKTGQAISPKLQAQINEMRASYEKGQKAMTESQSKAGKERLANFKSETDEFAEAHRDLYDKIVAEYSDSQRRMTVTQASEAKRRLKEVEKALEKEKTLYIELDEVADQAMQGPKDNKAWIFAFQERQKAAEAYKQEIIEIDMYQDELSQYPKGTDADLDNFRKSVQDVGKEARETVDNFVTNVQEGVGDVLSDALRGDLDNIADVFGTIKDIALDVFADIASAFVIKPMIEKGMNALLGGAFMQSGSIDDLGGAVGGLVDKIQSITIPVPGTGGGSVTGGQVAQGAAAAAAGIGVGYGVSQAVGGGLAGSVMGGAVGGGLAGAMIFGPIGAAVGAVVGAIGGLVAALVGGSKDVKAAIAPLTTALSAGPPTAGNVAGGAGGVRRGPFGFISLVEESSGNVDPGTVAAIIAEADSAIADIMTSGMRDVASIALQGQHYALDAQEMDDAIAQAIQTRYFIILRDILASQGNADPNAAAINITGEPYTGTAENIAATTQRVQDAINILKMIEEIKVGPLGEVATAIRDITERTELLALRARELGLEGEAQIIEGEGERLKTEVATDNLEGLNLAIAQIEDPAKAAAMELQAYQDQVWANAVAADAVTGGMENQNAATRLFALQWQEHAEQYGTTADGVVEATDGMTAAMQSAAVSMSNFIAQGMSPAGQQVLQLTTSYQTLRAEAERLQMDTTGLTQAYQQQIGVISTLTLQNLAMTTLEAKGDQAGAALIGLEMEIAQWEQTLGELHQQLAITDDQYNQSIATLAEYEQARRDAIHADQEAAEAARILGIAQGQTSDPFAPLWDSIDALHQSASLASGSISSVDIEIQNIASNSRNLSNALLEMYHTGRIGADEYRAGIDSINQSTRVLIDSAQEAAHAAEILAIATGQSSDAYAGLWISIDSFLTRADLASGATTELAITIAENTNQAYSLIAALNMMASASMITGEAAVYGAQQIMRALAILNAQAVEQAYGEQNRAAFGAGGQQGQWAEWARLHGYGDYNPSRESPQDYLKRTGGGNVGPAPGGGGGGGSGGGGGGSGGGGSGGGGSGGSGSSRQREIEARQRADAARREQARAGQDRQREIADRQREDAARRARANVGGGGGGSVGGGGGGGSSRQREIEARQRADAARRDQASRATEQRRGEAQRQAETRQREAAQKREQAQREAEQKREEAKRKAEQRREDRKRLVENIEDFTSRSKSGTTQSLIGLKNEFEDLNEEAKRLGVGTGTLTRAYKEQRAEIIRQAKAQFQEELYGFTDPFKASMIGVNEQVREFAKLAQEGIISRKDVRRFQSEATQNARFEEASRLAAGGGNAASQFFEQARAFQQEAARSGAAQEIYNLTQEYNNLMRAMKFLGQSTTGLTRDYLRQVTAVRVAARRVLLDSIDGIIDPFAAAIRAINDQLVEFQRQVLEGLVTKAQVARWRAAALEEANINRAQGFASGEYTAAGRYKTPTQRFYEGTITPFVDAGKGTSNLKQQMNELGETGHRLMMALQQLGDQNGIQVIAASVKQQADAIIREAHSFVNNIIWGFGQPFNAAMEQANAQIKEVQKLFTEGLIFQWQADWATRMIKADTVVQEALRRMSGGPVNAIEEVANAFDQFIRAGNPMSEAGQRLFNLTETFINLADAANLLGMSTAELEQSYLEQAKTIKEEGIKAIEDQLSAQISGINSIKDYLSSLKMSSEQPGNVQIAESQKLFNEALAGTDIQEMISTAGDLRSRALDYYGTTEAFYGIERNITSALESIRAREEAAVAAERERLTQQLEREIRQLEVSVNSLDQLQRIRVDTSDTARGIDELIALARAADMRESQTNELLRRIAQQLRA